MLKIKKYEYSLIDPKCHKEVNKIGKALSHPIRTNMLCQIHEHPLTISELAKLNNICIKNAMFHINILLESGMIRKLALPTSKDGVSLFVLTATEMYFDYSEPSLKEMETYTQEISVGMYATARFDNILRLATQEKIVRLHHTDVYNPIRKDASLLWTDGGSVTYSFAKYFLENQKIESVNFSFEICSETNGYRNDFKSDITISVNGIRLGVFTSKGDFGDVRGKHNPPYWLRTYTQYGHLVVVSITNNGTYIDHQLVSDIKIKDIKLNEHDDLRLTIENEKNAKHYGGFNLFGKGFGNYDQDILLTINYKP